MSRARLRLEGVTCAYDGTPVLVDADLEIGAADFTGIVGPSGSGKTTLLRAVLGTVDAGRRAASGAGRACGSATCPRWRR